MFSIFKKKSPKDKLSKQYKKLMEESHRLSTTNRKASDLKRMEAEEVLKKIEDLEKDNS
tara:strand:+ start:238 stop:414 length:177 start_codon:yes stop_codon:yes gene_type:complete